MTTKTCIPVAQLPSGHLIPVLGVDFFWCLPGAATYNAVRTALELGYYHIDTTHGYGNEVDVGRAIADSGIPREQLFVTNKYFADEWTYDDVMREVTTKATMMGGYVDLFLLHAPASSPGRADAWRALEDAKQQCLTRDIGVANFDEKHLQKLAETWREKPAVNQVELHPWLCRTELVKYCHDNQIAVSAYSPLASASKQRDPTLVAIANTVQATPAQVLIAWSLAKGYISIPKAAPRDRLEEILGATDLLLTAEQVAQLDALDQYFVTSWDPVKDHPV